MTRASSAAQREHVVAISVDGQAVTSPIDYDIRTSLLEPVNTFSLTVPANDEEARELWKLLGPDRPCKVMIDGVGRIDGFIDKRRFGARDGTITVSGRSKVGRLVQESAPAVEFVGKTLSTLAAELAAPWFSTVTLSNARNRNVLRGRGGKAKARDAVVVDVRVGRRLEPGQMRFAILEDLARQANCIIWESGDGKELIIGRPSYSQEVQFEFLLARTGSGRDSNVLDLVEDEDTGDRYSKITVLGSGAGTDANYGLPVSARAGEARNNAATADGEGGDFSAPKRLVLVNRELRDRKAAAREAELEMARRDQRGRILTVEARRHGQQRPGARYPTLYTEDTLAYVENEVLGTKELFLIVGCNYRSSRTAGEVTTLELVPAGTELVL